jgi:hypothetical protein
MGTRETVILKGVAAAMLGGACAAGAQGGAPPRPPVPVAPSRKPPAPLKLPSPSGRITFRITGPMMNGTQTYYWADGGKRVRQEFKVIPTSAMKAAPVDAWVIYDGKYGYVHTAGKKVLRRPVPPEQAAAGLGGMTALGMGTGVGQVIGKEQILGKPCEVRQQAGVKVWVWQGLTLKAQVTPPSPAAGRSAPGTPRKGAPPTGPTTVEAMQLDVSTHPAESLFKVPAGYEITDAPTRPPGGAPGMPGSRPGLRR